MQPSASVNVSVAPSGTSIPAPRKMRANATAIRSGASRTASGTARHRGADDLGQTVRAHAVLVLAIFEDRSERRVDRFLVEPGAPERRQCLRPVDRFRHPRWLVQL